MGESTSIVRRITDDVLFIAKVESDQFNLIFSPFSVSAVLMSTVQQHQPPAAVKGVDFSMAIEPGIPPLVLGDSSRIRQVLTNLASNGMCRICARRRRRVLARFSLPLQPSSLCPSGSEKFALFSELLSPGLHRKAQSTVSEESERSVLARGAWEQTLSAAEPSPPDS